MPDEEPEETSKIEIPTKEPATLRDAANLGMNLGWINVVSNTQKSYKDPLTSTLKELSNLSEKFKEENIIKRDVEGFVEEFEEKYDDGEIISGSDMEQIQGRYTLWANEVARMLDRETRIAVHDYGLFDVKEAMNNPELLFKPEVWNWLPEFCRKDIEESCRSLAAKCPTASVMLSLRAVEERLRFWYKTETGKEIDNPYWGNVIGELESHYEENRPPVLSNLDYLREKRNEVNHPDKSPTFHEAVTTLYVMSGTIREIYGEVEEN